MTAEIVALAVLTAATVLLHGLGMLLVLALFGRDWPRLRDDRRLFSGQGLMIAVVAIMLVAHVAESAMWAAYYAVSGALPDFDTAFYFSLSSYTSVGYGDVLLAHRWRQFGPIEAACGMLMFGWSTGMLFAVATRLRERHAPADEP